MDASWPFLSRVFAHLKGSGLGRKKRGVSDERQKKPTKGRNWRTKRRRKSREQGAENTE
jgi:hypothetical protein